MKLHILDHCRCWNRRGSIIPVLLCLALSGCGNDDPQTSRQDKINAEPQPHAVTKKTVPEPEPAAEAEIHSESAPSHGTIPAAIQKQVDLIPETAAPQLKLDISPMHLDTLQKHEVDLLQQPAPQRLGPVKKADKKLEVGGGIITDPEAADLSESVDGAKVNLDLKWN